MAAAERVTGAMGSLRGSRHDLPTAQTSLILVVRYLVMCLHLQGTLGLDAYEHST